MKLFAPVALAQARWPSLGPLLARPMEWSDTAEVAETTILLLKAMGFRVTSRPSPWILSDWKLDLASVELLRWRGKLRKAFGIKPRLLTASDGGSQLGGAGYQLSGMESQPGEMPSKILYRKDPKGGQPATNPSKIMMMKSPETKKGERFRATAETPYFEDSHMLSPKKSRTRLGRNKWESEEDNSVEEEDDSGDDHGYRPSRDETVKDQIYHLSNDRGDQGGSQYLELRSHVSLDKIAQFDGRRYRSDDSLQWLKRFIYEMKGTPSWCEPFSLSLRRTAKSWYRQLPRKSQTRWNLLSEAFLDYYCSQFDQSARTRYYSAKRKDKETICDFLTWLNGYARTAKIQSCRAVPSDCGDDDIMDMLYPLQLNDIHRVEQIINKKILGEKRKKQRDRLVSGRSRDEMRRDDRRSDRRREDKCDARRDDKREVRREDRRSDRRREEIRDRRINTADYVVEELYGSTGHAEVSRGRLSRDAELYDAEDSDGYIAYGQGEDAESEVDADYVDTGFTSDRGGSARIPRNSARSFRGSTEGRDRRDTSRERQQYGPCDAWGTSNMGLALLAEAWATRLTFVGDGASSANKSMKSANVNSSAATRSWLPSSRITLTSPKSQKNSKISTRRSVEPVVEANFVFAFVGEAGWPEGSVGTDEGMCDSDGNERESEESDEDDSAM
ncbi:LOW QUALITY PROTEIN: Hypothetical protein PHPALM_16183, partial [Phytophthora palmivora]